jgi:hypothetical protein
MSINIYQPTWRNIPEHFHLHKMTRLYAEHQIRTDVIGNVKQIVGKTSVLQINYLGWETLHCVYKKIKLAMQCFKVEFNSLLTRNVFVRTNRLRPNCGLRTMSAQNYATLT